MANGLVSLGYLRMQAQQRADMESNPSISTPEWNQYIAQSYKELYDLLVAAYGNDYFVASPYQFTLNGAQFYNLPDGTSAYQLPNNGGTAPAFYKLLGVDLQYSSSPTGWVTLKRFETIDRNKAQFPNTGTTSNTSAYSNLRYRLSGSQLWFIPIPAAATAQIWYIPRPTDLIFASTATTTAASAVITVKDVSGLAVGMSVYTSSGVAANTTISSINTVTKQVTLSAVVSQTLTNAVFVFWSDAATVDGVSGWEEFIIIDAAIKAGIKQETDIEPLLVQKQAIVKRIEAMAEGRDAGQAHHVSDALSINGFGDGFDDPFGFGGMGGY